MKNSSSTWIASSVCAAGIVFNALTLGRATVGLSVGLVVSLGIWLAAGRRSKQILPLYLVCIALFCAHFAEEYRTGFFVEFPRLFSVEWSASRFLVFNAVWLAVFAISAAGVYFGRAEAYFIVIFFALAGGILNGAAHIVLSVAQWRYFPGTLTAPFMLVGGVMLLRRLL